MSEPDSLADPLAKAQAQKKATVFASLGAAVVASMMTVAMLSGHAATPSAPAQAAAAPKNACTSLPLMITVSTETGGGNVRFREGDYLSPPITLSRTPQTVYFPRPRPEVGQIQEPITMEGDATNLVMVSPVTHARHVYPKISGSLTYMSTWYAFKVC
jgi:hypothetical protein